uniref:CSON012522 protein n=1 Tax=Culicoides sonorensis TaxID=179676 RepID=A0A336LHG4_CULSO
MKNSRTQLQVPITTIEFPVRFVKFFFLNLMKFKLNFLLKYPHMSSNHDSLQTVPKKENAKVNERYKKKKVTETLPRALIVKHEFKKSLPSSFSSKSSSSNEMMSASTSKSQNSLPDLPKCPKMNQMSLDSEKDEAKLQEYLASLEKYRTSMLSMANFITSNMSHESESSKLTFEQHSEEDPEVARARRKRVKARYQLASFSRSLRHSFASPQQKTLPVVNLKVLVNERIRKLEDNSFVYMTYVHPKTSEFFTPYTLAVVPYSKVNRDEYITMSRHGITYWSATESNFTELDVWMDEFEQYTKLMKINIFKKYRLWKSFKVWLKSIQRRKFNNARQFIAENLFIVTPALGSALLEIRTKINDLNQKDFVDISVIENWSIVYFMERQVDACDILRTELTEYHKEVRELLYHACAQAIRDKGFLVEDEATVYKTARKMKEMMSFTDRANKRRFCQRLCCFLYLIDYMTICMLGNILHNTFVKLLYVFRVHDELGPTIEELMSNDATDVCLEKQRPADGPQRPLLNAELILKPECIEIDPPQELTLHIVQELIRMIMESADKVERFQSDEYYNFFVEPSIMGRKENRLCGNPPDFEHMLEINVEFLNNKKLIPEIVALAYEKVYLYIKRFDPIREAYKDDLETNPKIIRSETNLDRLNTYCERYIYELDVLEKLVSECNIGLLHVNQDILKREIIPICKELQTILNVHLPILARQSTKAVQEKTEYIHDNLSTKFDETKPLVQFLHYLDECGAKIDNIKEDLLYAYNVFRIMKEHNVTVLDDLKDLYLDVEEQLQQLERTLQGKIESKPKIVGNLNKCLQSDIQKIFAQVENVRQEIIKSWFLDENSDQSQIRETLAELQETLSSCQDLSQEYRSYQKEFKIELTRFDTLDQVNQEVKLRQTLWDSVSQWKYALEQWNETPFHQLNMEELTSVTTKILKNCGYLEKNLPKNDIIPKLKADVEDFKDKLPVLGYLRNSNLKKRHWIQIEQILEKRLTDDDTVNIFTFEDANAFESPLAEFLAEISGQASAEASLEGLLKTVENAWKEQELAIVTHRDYKDIYILAGIDELQTILDDSNINIATILASRHVGPIKEKVLEWEKNLVKFSETLDEWVACQQTWVYLEAIFTTPDIQRQLPEESRKFNRVDKNFKEIMRSVHKTPLALSNMTKPGVLEIMKTNNALLEDVTRSLEAYLELKRVAFPRFYFLSNDELLEILAQTRNPFAIQPHLRKCFDAISQLKFKTIRNEEGEEVKTNNISAMVSPEGEIVTLMGLKARGAIEDWLSKVEKEMFASLKRFMKLAHRSYPTKDRSIWFQEHPNQLVLTVSQQQWALQVHEILDNSNEQTALQQMKEFEGQLYKDLTKLASIARSDIPRLLRRVLCALITIDVHAKDTISNMVEKRITKSTDFDWLKMLRYYWNTETETMEVKMASASLPYFYEYLGASGVLVITPLTDRCYLCLMGALQMNLGGAPAGPAGTGKTETTKDLAKAVAIQCIVFNCSEGLDYKMMGRFFSGLAQSGAWCCFDEFNRIDIEVLSVIAQQLITIQNAKAMNLSRFIFEGREIKLISSCSAFITMNPGYAGRTELPDNLKALFRPISMMVPDYALIAEVILYSEGFTESKILARKMVQMYKLCSEQLSQQDHYDFGMRAVKSVLVMAGALKRASPDQSEDITLISALRDSNLPKFLAEDAILFKGILKDLFPDIELPKQNYGHLENAIIKSMETKNLQPVPALVTKTIQLFETMVVRWGVMLVGPTGSGKTSVLHSLASALSQLSKENIEGPYYRDVRIQTLNPKSISLDELYGAVNNKTLEWKDGLLGIAVRSAVHASTEDQIHQWIVCDGPVDAIWIENLNTVLDDNKMLCLANSERIKLTSWIHMLFEVQDLAQASPATVSRCGMVYIDPLDLGWKPLLDSWLKTVDESILPETLKEYLKSLFLEYFEDVLKYGRQNCDYAIHQVEVSKLSMFLTLMQALLKQCGNISSLEKEEGKKLICKIFIWSMLWSIGCNFLGPSKITFESHIRSVMKENPNADLPYDSLWNYQINETTKKWQNWKEIVPPFNFDPKVRYFDMLVPTSDTIRFGKVAELLFNENYPVMFTGDTGVGKSVLAKVVLQKLSLSDVIPTFLNFSAQTNSARTQEMIEARLEKRKKTMLGAPLGKRVIIFVDDVNMPKLDAYGSQPPIELLKQLLDFRGVFDREKSYWKDIVNVVLGAACAPPGGGRNPLTPRFVRHFAQLFLPAPTKHTLTTIFTSILIGFFEDFTMEVSNLARPLVFAAVDVYERISKELLPTPAKSHYVFNLRDLSKCVQGILQADSSNYASEQQVLRLFYHESMRVFHDRLIDEADKIYFKTLMDEVSMKYFDAAIVKPDEVLLFGDFMIYGQAKEDRVYEEIRDFEKLKSILIDYLNDYNTTSENEMKLILFNDAIEHITRLTRLLRAERGNGLLVGVTGMGKQSLTKLASHVNGYVCFQIELTRGYDQNSFHEDLRKFYYSAGTLNKPTVFLITDNQIIKEEFLEDINNILNSGEVPNLFEGDDYEKIILETRQKCIEAKYHDTSRDGIFEFFIKRVRENLHIVICMSPIGDAFRRRCRTFPSLVNCCTIDWFVKWPSEALFSVALGSLKETAADEEQCNNLAKICVMMHENVEDAAVKLFEELKRNYYTTPSSYLELLKQYHTLLKKRKDSIIAKKDRISNGLNKLLETNELVAVMGEELQKFVPVLEEKSRAMKEMLIKLDKDNSMAEAVKKAVLKDEAEAKIKAQETQDIADEATRELEAVLPLFRMAQAALEKLSKADISEVKSLKDPPKAVKFVMEAVCILMGAKPEWKSAQVVMNDTNFLKRLQEYDKEHIPDERLQRLRPYLDDKGFDPAVVERHSKTAKSICLWVRAIDRFATVYKDVEPKLRKKQQAENDLKQVVKILKQKQGELAEVESKIEELKAELALKQKEMQILQDNNDLTASRLNRASRLTSALSDEEIRWKESIKMLSDELSAVPGDVLVSSACVAYLGAFPITYRTDLVKSWVEKCKEFNIPSSSDFDLVKILGEPFTIRTWIVNGLPSDEISIENALIVTQSSRWPLMIDPQEQANRWIRNLEKENDLKVTKLSDPMLMRLIESAIRQGSPILIEEIGETLDPALGPILNRQISSIGGRHVIRIGDQEIEYDAKFRLYMTTKLSNPHYLPEVCIQVTLVNFIITFNGLEDQLLSDVVRIELPELEQKRNDLVTRINTDKQQLVSLEDKVLLLLFTSEGNILDDEVLVETLNEAKETSTIIASRLIDTERTEETITAQRETYRPLASRGAVLFFVVITLADIDPMYQFSLRYFTQVFCSVIEVKVPKMKHHERLKYLLENETYAIYTNISRGLFEKDKLIFSFMIATAIQRFEKRVTDKEFEFLLRGPYGKKSFKDEKPDERITDQQWLACEFIEENFFSNFKGLCDDVEDNIKLTIQDFSYVIKLTDKNRNSDINWDRKLTPFQKLMLIRALCEEQLVIAIGSYVRHILGMQFTEPAKNTSISAVFEDTSSTTPLIFVLSTGSDPMATLQKFAIEKNYVEKLHSISLGQGQGPAALKLLEKGRLAGHWVFLQNCHLATSFMYSMEQIIRNIVLGVISTHPDFRIFLSSKPDKTFPVSVLQNSVKVTNEPPKGLRSNLIRALTDLDKDGFEHHILDMNWKRMIFGICMFHGVILERRKFGPLGWNILYEFNESDRECALQTLEMFCDREVRQKIPWDALEYINGEITYGGRVTDNWDQRCLKAILKTFSSPKIFIDNYQYSPSGIYRCPDGKTLDNFMEYVQSLPFNEPPEIFGMHENANIVFQRNETQFFIQTILQSQQSSGNASSVMNVDEICFGVIETIRENVVKKIEVDQMHSSLTEIDQNGRIPSLSTVLLQEIERFSNLLLVIHESLDDLEKAIKGFVVMSESLEAILGSFLQNQVPELWNKKGFLSTKCLASWTIDLKLRVDYIQTWINDGLPISNWICGLFFPQSFVTGILQTHARSNNFPIDALHIDFEVLDETPIQQEIYEKRINGITDPSTLYNGLKRPEIGAIIHGLYIEAGRWDKDEGGLSDGRIGELTPRLPAVWLKPCFEIEVGNRYEAPLYKTGLRAGTLSTTGHSTNFVMSVLLDSEKPPDYWILQGTALITLTTD